MGRRNTGLSNLDASSKTSKADLALWNVNFWRRRLLKNARCSLKPRANSIGKDLSRCFQYLGT